MLPAALLWQGEADVFSFVRASDPRRVLTGRLALIEPLLAEGGIVFDEDEPTETMLDDDAVRFLLRDAIPRLDEQGVTVLLPASWVSASARLKVNLVATSAGPVGRGSGLLARDTLATFNWQLALGDVTLTEAELAELAAAKEPLLRIRGRWHALRRADVDRALRFLERRREGNVVDLVRAVGGVETDDAGLELGEVTLDDTLTELLTGSDQRSFRELGTPKGMRYALFPFQERGHGWLRFLGDLGVGAILADDMGLGKTVQAIAMLVSEREEGFAGGPTLVVCPMSITRQWAKEIDRFAPELRVHLHHGAGRLTGEALAEAAAQSDVVVTSYDIATRDIEHLEPISWDRLLFDEAQDAKNPATKRARAMRRLRGSRRLALTGTPIENRLGELWAIMDLVNPGLLGSHDRFDRMFARPIEAGHDELRLARLRTMVQPFILRRAKDDDEVALDLPSLITRRVECHLTVEQASLYRATVDRWLPRVEEHEDRFGRRGAVLAMLSQLKQICNHPELVVPTGNPLEGRSGKLDRLVELLLEVPTDDKALVFTQYPGFDRLAPYLAEQDRTRGRVLPRWACRPPPGGACGGLLDARRAVSDGGLDQGRRAWAQPAGREPRLPLRPLVEPGRRAAGDRSRVSLRPDQGRDRLQPDLQGNARGAHRPAPREQARARRQGHLGSRGRLARRSRSRCDSGGGRALRRSVRGGRMSADRVLVDDGRALRLEAETRPGKGPWARLVASAIVPDERSPRAQRGLELARGGMLHSLAVGPGVVAARVSGSEEVDYEVELHTRPLPPRVWAAATKAPEWSKAAQGREQSVALEHELAAGWGEPLIPPGRAVRRSCTCPDVDFSGTCKHLVALAYLFSEAIDGDPSLLLRWRGCLAETATPADLSEVPIASRGEMTNDDEPDPWVGGPVPEIGPARSLPVGAVLKRLGPSGLRLDGVELIELLEPAYAAFARAELRADRGSESIDG